jgi:hypothetical protein
MEKNSLGVMLCPQAANTVRVASTTYEAHFPTAQVIIIIIIIITWEDNIKMDIQEVGWGAWTGLIRSGGGLLLLR